MSHVFTDAVHRNNWLVFPDYLTWLRETLHAIRQIHDVNWLVKPHPSERWFRPQQTAEGEYRESAADCQHVRILPYDVNTASVLNVAHAMVTCCGTSGIEFSCYGIPCVLAGEAPYSSLGFTLEPQSVEEYFALLSDISKVDFLDSSQIEKAKVLAFIYFRQQLVYSCLNPPMHLHPLNPDFDEDKFWQEAMHSVQQYRPEDDRYYQAQTAQVSQCPTHLVNPQWEFASGA